MVLNDKKRLIAIRRNDLKSFELVAINDYNEVVNIEVNCFKYSHTISIMKFNKDQLIVVFENSVSFFSLYENKIEMQSMKTLQF